MAAKQAFETVMIKSFVTSIPRLAQAMGNDPESAAALNARRAKMWERQAKPAADVRAAVAPVRHTLVIAEAKP